MAAIPAVDEPIGGAALDTPRSEIAVFLAALARTERLPAERLQAYQRRLLEVLVRHARAETGFYPARLAPLFGPHDRIDWDGWSRVPILTRAEAQAEAAAMTARSIPKAAGNATEDTSSGSTGIPFRHRTTDLQNLASACASERFFRWHGLRPEALTVRIRAASAPEAAYPHGRRISGWRVGHPQSEVIDLAISADVEDQRRWLDRVRPAYLVTYPTNMRELARSRDRAGGGVPFEAVLTFGEMTTQDMAETITGHFGSRPLDRYGTTETGHIAGTCPEDPGLHVASELVLLEIVDPAGKPVAPGEAGRVVVTSFYNLAMPLIRYDVGDYAVLSPEPCRCGRSLPLLQRVLGRSRNMFRLPDGSTVWPVLHSRDMQAMVPSRQFQIVQSTPTDYEFRYVPLDPGQANDLPALEGYFRRLLHPQARVTAVPLEQIPRSAGGKYEDYISLVPPPSPDRA